MLQITKQKWDQIPNDYKSIWKSQHKQFDPNLPNNFIGKRTVFEGCINPRAGTVLITEDIHFIIV